jgi:tetratricopeptide (TPR) repeat protein
VKRVAALLVPAAALLLAACAGAPPAATPAPQPPPAPAPAEPGAGVDQTAPAPGAAPFTALAARFTARALKQEAAGDLRRALDSWKVVAGLRPDAAEPRRRVADLAARLKEIAERHFRDGGARLQEGNIEAARKEFLLTLAADPDHADALDALKNRLEPDAASYTVLAGDTFESIAKKQYGDAAKAPIVARANSLDPAGKPSPGTTLALPSLAPPAAKPAPRRTPEAVVEAPEPPDSGYETEPGAPGGDGAEAATPPAPAEPAAPAAPVAPAGTVKAPDPAEAQLAKAQALFQAKKFEEAGAAADKLAGSASVGARAKELAGTAWFAAGEAALKEDRFLEAAAAFRKAEPGRKDAAAALAGVERRKKEKAEEAYNAGVRFFINQKLDDAIRSWETTLALNPEHPKAPKDIEKARGLQQKLKDLR